MTAYKVWLDDETFSPAPITNGVHRYAESVEILIRALALGDGPVLIRDLTPGGGDWLLAGSELIECPVEYIECIELALNDEDAEVWAHNSAFDRTVERHAGLNIPAHRWRDTMVQALAHGLPAKLDSLCEALRLPTDKAKDKAGKALIQLFCKPQEFRFRKRDKGEKKADYDNLKAAALTAWLGRATRDTHPAEWRKFLMYAGRDIEAMRAAHKLMPMWNYRGEELALWQLDQRINDRGVMIDLDLAECAINAVDAAQIDLRERAMHLTAGEVESATKRDALLLHVLTEYGVDLPDLQAATLERRILDPSLPEGLRELLRVRLQASTTSTSKYRVLVRATSSDGRLRGLLQFNGASRTGRWAGRLWQPQNLPSRGLLPQKQIALGIDALKGGYADLVFPNVMHLTSSAIRGCVVAPRGRKLVVADLSNIEGRDQAWLAGEAWKLKAFADFDTVQTADGGWLTGMQYFDLCRQNEVPELAVNEKGEPIRKGHDLYKMAYGKSFNVRPEDVTKDQRQVGKVQELALGYEGGVAAFLTFAATYAIDLDDLAEKAVKFIPGEVWGQANIMLSWHRSKGRDPAAKLGLADRTWLVCESFKLGWRAGHANIKAHWKALDLTVREAITNPGVTLPCGRVRIRRDGAWLRIVLPSGRAICYPSPRLEPEKRRAKDAGELDDLDALADEEVSTGRTKISYMGLNQYTPRWGRIDTYGGKIFENICQAVARDVMAYNMPLIEAAGYQIILTVHDEVICEAPDEDCYNPEHLAALLCASPPWADGMPLAAAGFESYRYKKD
jgi:DNA polymerase